MNLSPVHIVAALEPEDRLRADFYALFANLFLHAPDAELLRVIGSAPLLDAEADGAALAIAWSRLSAASRVMGADAAADEFDALFGGIGKSVLSLYGSYYVGEGAPGAGSNFLVALRDALADLGLGLQVGQNLPEDHLSAVLETMRLLIAGADAVGPFDLPTQRAFFASFIAPWYERCCTAIVVTSLANYYKSVAECFSAYLSIESQSFEIE